MSKSLSSPTSSSVPIPVARRKGAQYNALVSTSVWQFLRDGPLKISIIGSGNWGTAIARIVAINAKRCFFFEDTVRMYVYEEMHNGKKLSEIINTTHENAKYLPGITLPDNIVALPDVRQTVDGSHILIFVMPHQFIKSLCSEMAGHVMEGAKAISLVKGFDCEANKINLMTEFIRNTLLIECSSLSGANVAEGVAKEEFSETTIGYADIESVQLFQQLFDTPYFRVNAVPDVAGVEICGALKNIVALSAGFVDGLGYGSNTKAAIIRIGMVEMRKFAGMFYENTIDETFWDSAGFADLFTTCIGGRNRKCAEEFAKTGKSWKEIETNMLNGQKLQGTHTCRDVYSFLNAQGLKHEFPLFTTTYEICDCGAPPKKIVEVFMSTLPRQITKTRSLIRAKL